MGVLGKVDAPSILVHDSSFPRLAASFMTSSQESTVAQKNTARQVVFLLGVLGMFFASLELMEDSFKLMGGGVAEYLLEAEYLLKMASNPFVGLFIGILATSLVQSGSTTTTRTVSLVAAVKVALAHPVASPYPLKNACSQDWGRHFLLLHRLNV